MEQLLKIENDELQKKSTLKGKNTIEKVNNTLTEELFIALCSPIGSLKEPVIDRIKDLMNVEYNYEVEVIKLSNFIDNYDIELNNEEDGSIAFNKYYNKITKGNEIRKTNNNAYLAEKAIELIHLERLEILRNKGIMKPKTDDFETRRKLYIIDSLKNFQELELFRNVYTENFYQISLFSPLEDRKNNLKRKGFKKDEIEKIFEIDDKQNLNYGQNVRGTFVEGDFFMRVSEENFIDIETKVERFFSLIFESKINTPTIEEKSMYLAKSESGNSACLSRQVGACIIDENNNIISTGWNDVPKFGGNLYTSESKKDNRCFNKGYCSNDFHKSRIINEIVESFIKDPKIKTLLEKEGKIDNSLIENFKQNLKDSKVKDLIEFSRSVHAEMHAIIQGSQLTGDKMINGKLFCTTYPCHNCARHIIAAGIKEVYYIEPYVKSLSLTLYSDSMTENEEIQDKVKILMFDGVAPRNYLIFFTNLADRKSDGKTIKKDLKLLKPKKAKSLQALSTLEQQAVHSLSKN